MDGQRAESQAMGVNLTVLVADTVRAAGGSVGGITGGGGFRRPEDGNSAAVNI